MNIYVPELEISRAISDMAVIANATSLFPFSLLKRQPQT